MDRIFQIIVYGLLTGGVYGLVAVGLTLIFGVLKIVNFAHGEFLMVAMYISFWGFRLLSIDPYLGSIVVIIVMYFFGNILYRMIMNPIIYKPHVVQIFTTVALSLLLQNAALLLFKADFRNIRTAYSLSALNISGIKVGIPNLISFTIAIVASILIFIFLKKTDLGKAMRAIAQNDRAAKLVGINVDMVYRLTYSIALALVGLGGIALVPMYSTYPTVGASFINPAFASVVLGGLGSVTGAVIGGIIIGLVESLTAFYIGPEFQQIAYFSVFLIILVIKPQGIMGKKEEII